MYINCKRIKSCIKNIDLISGLIGMALGVLIAILSIFGVINQFFIGLTVFCITSLYIFIRPKIRLQRKISNISISHQLQSILDISFWSLLSIALLIWHSNLYYRPASYFVIISILSAIIAIEIFSSYDSRRFSSIIFKIVILSLVVRGGIYFNYPSIMGYDAYLHTKIADLIMHTGFVPPYEISGKYVYAPILHILIGSVGVLSHVPVKYAVFLSIGVGSVISTFFLYIIGKNIAGPQIGLLAVLFANLTNDLIVRGIANVTADSVVISYLLVMLYLVFADNIQQSINQSMLVFFSLLLVITHQLSTFVVFLIMLILMYSQLITSYVHGFRSPKNISITYLTLFGIAIIAYWMSMEFPNRSTFFDFVLAPFMDILRGGGEYGSDILIVGRVHEQPIFYQIIIQSSYLILPFFAIGGLLLWLSPENRKRFSIATVAAALLVLVYGIPLLGIRNLITSRWIHLLSIFLAILAAAFIWCSVNLMPSRTGKKCFAFLIVFIFAFIMITTPGINKDNPLVGRDVTVRNQFTCSEVKAAETIGSSFDVDTYVDSTFLSAYKYYTYRDLSDREIEFSKKISEFSISGNDDMIGSNNLFVLRTCTRYEPITVKASHLYGDLSSQIIPQSFFEKFESHDFDMVYSNSYVLGYLSC